MLATQTKNFGSDCKWFFKIRIICTLEVIFYATIENKDYFCGRSETINVPHCLPWWAGCRAPCRGLSPASCTWARHSSHSGCTAGPASCPAPAYRYGNKKTKNNVVFFFRVYNIHRSCGPGKLNFKKWSGSAYVVTKEHWKIIDLKWFYTVPL